MKTPFQPHILLAMGRHYNDRIHQGIADYAGQHHWHLTNLFTDQPKRVIGRRCDGVLSVITDRNPFVQALFDLHRPMVNLTLAEDPLSIPQVTGDNADIGSSAARHFLERGFRHFIGYAERMTPSTRARMDHYTATLAGAGFPATLMVTESHFRRPPVWEGFCDWIHRMLEQTGTPCAVYAYNDSQAVEWMAACMEAGLRIPEEVAVLGTDDNALICQAAPVPLSSIRHDLYELGWRGAATMEALLRRHPLKANLIEVPHRGIAVRRSTDVFAVNDPGLRHALRFLYQNFTRPISVQEIAQASGISRRVLERRFQSHLGTSALKRLQNLRLAEARRLLRETRLPIADIAPLSGFHSAEYLHRVFKNATGLTPRGYRHLRNPPG